MNYNNWQQWYEQIIDDFGFSVDADIKSAEVLNKLVDEMSFEVVDVDVKDKAILFGAGPSIKKHIAYLKRNVNMEDYTLIAADGATEALMEEKITPDIIVTDLDGNFEPIFNANLDGAILYVHAHGDNIEKIERYIPYLKDVIPTTQAKSYGNLVNYGGFTDGDRALHIIVYAYGIRDVILAGMDFGDVVSRYSRPDIRGETGKADSFKLLKLKYAQKLIDSLRSNVDDLKITDLMDIV